MAVMFYIPQKVTFTKTTHYLKTHYHKLHDFQDPFCYDTNAALYTYVWHTV